MIDVVTHVDAKVTIPRDMSRVCHASCRKLGQATPTATASWD